ncbi:MAG: C40 family peptidase [Firmicutes bacterium]|nr:C40 family peptidase [Bacillota bacterium]
MRRILTFLIVVTLILGCALPVFADEAEDTAEELRSLGLVTSISKGASGAAVYLPDKEALGKEIASLIMQDGAGLRDSFEGLPAWASGLAGAVLGSGAALDSLLPSFERLMDGAKAEVYEDLLKAAGISLADESTEASGRSAEEAPVTYLGYSRVSDEGDPEERASQTPSGSSAFAPEEDPEADPDPALAAEERDNAVEEIIACAEKYLGVPYLYGGKTPAASDCSGYVIYVFHECGYEFTAASCQDLYRMSDRIKKSELQRGDLVFFKGTYETENVSHVGIYLGDGQMIHAGSKGICYTELSLEYWRAHYFASGRFMID